MAGRPRRAHFPVVNDVPFDPAPDGDDRRTPSKMPCVVIGGCANGAMLPALDVCAQFIELKRPTHIKPLTYAVQKVPEIANESDQYEVHVMSLQDSSETQPALIGLAVVRGRSLTWGFKQMVLSYISQSVRELKAAGLLKPAAKNSNKPH